MFLSGLESWSGYQQCKSTHVCYRFRQFQMRRPQSATANRLTDSPQAGADRIQHVERRRGIRGAFSSCIKRRQQVRANAVHVLQRKGHI
jgi:hypothetical protein